MWIIICAIEVLVLGWLEFSRSKIRFCSISVYLCNCYFDCFAGCCNCCPRTNPEFARLQLVQAQNLHAPLLVFFLLFFTLINITCLELNGTAYARHKFGMSWQTMTFSIKILVHFLFFTCHFTVI